MINPRPYTESHRSLLSGGTPGTTTGPRTSLNSDQGMHTHEASSETADETGGTKLAW